MTKQLEQLITAENVKNIGESIAVSAMKKMMLCSGSALNETTRLFKGGTVKTTYRNYDIYIVVQEKRAYFKLFEICSYIFLYLASFYLL